VDGDAALYFEPGDVPGLARALAELLADPERRRRLGRAAAERAGRFSWDEAARATAELLRAVGRGERP
jgi:glycosyltransferase involved in cell wall biosynthesis